MFKELKLAAFAVAASIATLSGSGQAWALDGLEGFSGEYRANQGLGPCSVLLNFQTVRPSFPTTRKLEVSLILGGNRWSAGGFYRDVNTGNLVPSDGPITEDILRDQCGLQNVSNLQQDGLSSDYLADDYYGFSFQATNPLDGRLSTYEFSFAGVSSSTWTSRVTPLPPDTTRPDVVLSGAPSTVTDSTPFPVVVTFSEDVSGFVDLGTDVNVTNGTVTSISGGPSVYTLEVTPDGLGDVEVSIPDGAAQDAAANLSTASNTILVTSVSGDTTAPSVILSGAPSSYVGTTQFTVTATFSEPVSGFDDVTNDITISNGTVTAIGGGALVYTLLVSPTGSGDVEITVPAAAAQDAAANASTASNTLIVRNSIVELTRRQIANFMLGRLNNLASNQPGLTRFLQGDGCRAFDANATEGAGSLNGCYTRGNAWAEVTGSWSDDSSYALGTFGAHAFVSTNLLIGGMVQFDHTDDDANNTSGQGWMVGPYFVAKTPDQPFFFEGRVLYGQSDNDITPIGTFTDSFDTERWLAQLRATGEYQVNKTTLMPLLDFTYADDTQKTYTDSLGNTISSQKVSLTQLTAGLDFSVPIAVQTGAFALNGGLSGIYSSTSGGDADYEGMRGRAELGFDYDFAKNGVFSASTFYDGIGSDYEGYGASLTFILEF